MTEKIHFSLIIPEDLRGMRLDQALAKLVPDYSRTQIQEWIKNSTVTVDARLPRSNEKVLGGEKVLIEATPRTQPAWEAESIALNIVYEDEAILIINKPVGMVVHPGTGNPSKTLLNAILHHAPALKDLPRAGILHRLDKDTSGLLIIAKTEPALFHLSKQMKARTISRVYQAIVSGLFTAGGTIDKPIGRHPIQRKKMAVTDTGRDSVTHYRVMEKYRAHTRLKIQLETGRTHQIRVHMAHIHHPVLGDQTYAGRLQLPKGATSTLIEKLRTFKRQALHAFELTIIHPITQKTMTWQAPVPEDMQELIKVLKEDIQ